MVVDRGLIAETGPDDGRLTVVDHDLGRYCPKELEGVPVGGQPVFHRLAIEVLSVEHMAVTEYHREEREPAAIAWHLDSAPAAPVGLGALAGRELQSPGANSRVR